jgi:superfamily II DNA/RNA helicase
MPQVSRLASLAKFKSSLVRLLVATDVASRGLDIPDVDLVLNYDVPPLPSDYLHRVGRTARAGRAGRALTFVTQYDVELVHAIERDALGGRSPLAALAPGLDEEAVLVKLGRVTTAIQLAKARLVESGFEEAEARRQGRKGEAAERTRKHAAAGAAAAAEKAAK